MGVQRERWAALTARQRQEVRACARQGYAHPDPAIRDTATAWAGTTGRYWRRHWDRRHRTPWTIASTCAGIAVALVVLRTLGHPIPAPLAYGLFGLMLVANPLVQAMLTARDRRALAAPPAAVAGRLLVPDRSLTRWALPPLLYIAAWLVIIGAAMPDASPYGVASSAAACIGLPIAMFARQVQLRTAISGRPGPLLDLDDLGLHLPWLRVDLAWGEIREVAVSTAAIHVLDSCAVIRIYPMDPYALADRVGGSQRERRRFLKLMRANGWSIALPVIWFGTDPTVVLATAQERVHRARQDGSAESGTAVLDES